MKICKLSLGNPILRRILRIKNEDMHVILVARPGLRIQEMVINVSIALAQCRGVDTQNVFMLH